MRARFISAIISLLVLSVFLSNVRVCIYCCLSAFLPGCMECRRGLAMGILSVCLSVRPSVCLSVKRVDCDKTE